MNYVASRVLHDALANSLGRILDISREQLRVSLWSAWRTGLTLENVALRCDAFEHLQLPLTLRSGRIGRIQAQVPWATLRSLRSPVVVELSDVHLCVVLRRDEELEEGAAGERAWLAKQAELVAAELAALAVASTAGVNAAAVAAAGRQGSMLESLMHHITTMLVNRLQLTVATLHIQFEDPQSGTCVGLQLRRLHTCLPGEAEHASLLLSEDAGVLGHGSAAARGSIQKQFGIEGLALYWQPGSSTCSGEQQQQQLEAAAVPGAQPAAMEAVEETSQPLPLPLAQQHLSYVLLPTDCVIHSMLQLAAGDGIRVHAAAIIHHLPLALDGRQAADMLALADRLAWSTARTKFAAFCPTGWRRCGPRAVAWRHVWQYAVNAVLHELRGERQGVAPWRNGIERARLRKQYVATYRLFLERKHLEGSAPPALMCEAEADGQLQELERQLSVNDILTYRHVAQRVLDASLAAASGMGTSMEDPAAATHRARDRVQLPPASVVGGPTLDGGGAAAAAVAAPRPASLSSSSSASGSYPGSATSSGRRRGYLAWGLSRAASFLRYLPYGTSGEGRGGSAAALPEPTEAELEELYQAVDFHPEEQQASAAAAAGRAGGGGAGTGLHFSLSCLVTSTSLLLLEREAPSADPQQQKQEDQWQHSEQKQEDWPGSLGAAATSSTNGRGGGNGSGIATIELERLQLGVQLQPDQTTASLSLAELAVHDLCSGGPGISSQLLSRGTAGGAVAGATSPSGGDDGPSACSQPPVVRLSFTASPAAAKAGHLPFQERRPQLDVLVQPLLLCPQPLCVQQLVSLVPPALAGSFHGHQLAVLNALGAEARCAFKARRIAELGPPLDLLVKVLDVEVQLGAADRSVSPGVVLRTGPITLHSVDVQQKTTAQQQGQEQEASPAKVPHQQQQRRQLRRQNTPTHNLTAAEAAAHLSAVIKQRRVAAWLGGAAAAVVGPSSSSGPSGSILDATAAVAAVEQRLVYQQFELTVADLQAAAVNLQLPGTNGGTTGPGPARSSSGRGDGSGGFGRQWQPVLQPVRLAGMLKVHRIAEDYSLLQAQVALQVDPISLSVTQSVVQLLVEALALPAPPLQEQAGAAPAAAALRPGSATTIPGSTAGGMREVPWPARSSSLQGSVSSSGGGGVVALDLQLSFLDLRWVADSTSSGSSNGRSTSGAVVALEARVACAGASVSVQSMLDGRAVQVSASRLLLHDLSPSPLQPHLPPPVHRSLVPRVARLLAIDHISVVHTATFGGRAGTQSETCIELQDLTVEGYAGEAGSFLSRLHERQATHVNVTVQDSLATTCTTVSASNLFIGHGLLLRLAALGEAFALEQQLQEPKPERCIEQASQQQQQRRRQGEQAALADTLPGSSSSAMDVEGSLERQQQDAAAPRSAAAAPPRQPMPSSLEQYPTTVEQMLLQSCSSQGSMCNQHDGAGGKEQAAAEAGSTPQTDAEQQQRQAAEKATLAPLRSPAPAKQILTSIHLTDCRLVLRYQPALHSGGGADGSTHSGGGGTLAGAGIPAATHDFLSVHHDLLALDLPLLRLQLPLHPAGLAAVAAADEQVAAAGVLSSSSSSEAGDSEEQPAGAASAGSGASSLPTTVAGSSVSWEEVPVMKTAAHTPASPELTFLKQQPQLQQKPRPGQQQLLLEAGKLALWAAAVGYARHAMLPLLQLPSLSLACNVCSSSRDVPVGCSTGSSSVGRHRGASRQRRHSTSIGGSPVTPSLGAWAPPSAARARVDAAAVVLSYSLDVASIDLRLHPSQLSMLTSALQLCQHELAVLSRDSLGGSAADTESIITSTSAEHQQQNLEAQRQPAQGAVATGGAQSGQASPVAAGADAVAPGHRQQAGAGNSPTGAAGNSLQQMEALAPSQQWQLDAAIGCIGLSLLGATASSSCLKLEWHDLQASCSAGSGSASAASSAPSPAGSSPWQHQPQAGPGGSPGRSSDSPGSHLRSEAVGQEASLEAQLSWRQLAAHVLHPRLSYTHPSHITPFAIAAAMGGDVHSRGSQRDEMGNSSPPAGASPRISMNGPAPPPAPEVLYQRGRGGLLSSTSTGMGGGVHRNLSAGLGLTEEIDQFHDAAAYLSHPSHGSSRYFSLAESEFEDATSELEGAQSPSLAQGSPLSLPLPLVVGSSEYDTRLLLLLNGQTAAAEAAGELASPASADGSTEPLGRKASAMESTSSGKQPEASGTASSGTLATVRLLDQQRRAAVEIDAVALRVHAGGWEDATRCLHTYAVLAKQAQRQYTLAAEARAIAPLGPQGLLAAALAPGAGQQLAPEEQAQQHRGLALRLYVHALLVELLADGKLEQQQQQQQPEGSGNLGSVGGLVPACTLQAQLQLEAEQGIDGSSQLKLLVPGLLLTVGVVPASAAAADGIIGLPHAVALPLQDSLLGLHQLELSLVSQQQHRQLQPAATMAEGSVLLGPAHQVSVGAGLAHASLWVHPRNLCAAAALAGHVHALAEALADSLPLSGGARGAAPLGGSAGEDALPRQLTFKLNVQKAALLLSLLKGEDAVELVPGRQHHLLAEPVPLLELAAAVVTADMHDMGQGSLEGTLKSELQVAVFSAVVAGWEPLLEPWHCRLQFAAPTSMPPPPTQHQRLAISSTQGLELTLTQAGLEAAVLVGGVLQAVAAVAEDPATLEAHLEAACSSTTYSAAYWLHNQTGSSLELWLAAGDGEGEKALSPGSSLCSQDSGSGSGSMATAVSRHGLRVPSGLPELVVRPGTKVVLPVVAATTSAAQHRGVHVGMPCQRQGVARPHQSFHHLMQRSSSRLGLAAAPGVPCRALSLFALSAASGDVSSPRQVRTLLYFRLGEQQDICGPLHLDRGCFHRCLGCTTACPGVLCDMEDARHGGYTLTLHSGVQLHNTTPLVLDIGVQTPMGLVMEPQALGTLRPGACMWLPALRAHTGLLCLRPAAVSGTRPPPRAHSLAPPLPLHALPAGTLQSAATWQSGDGSGVTASRIPSLAADSLAAAAALVTGNHSAVASMLPAQRLPSSPLLYSTTRLPSPSRHSTQLLEAGRQASGPGAGPSTLAAPWQPYEWSAAVPLQSLLRQAAGAEGGGSGRSGAAALEGRSRTARQLTCASAAEHQPPVLLCMGATRLSRGGGSGAVASTACTGASRAAPAHADRGSWEVLLSPPLVLHNALPVPLDVSLSVWGQEHRLHLQPNQHAALHAVDASQVESVTLRALGYHPSHPISPAPLSAAGADGGAGLAVQQQQGQAGAGCGSSDREVVAPDTAVWLREVGHSHSQVQLFVRHSLDTATGSHKLLFGCTLWVFNCTGVPVALRQSVLDPLFGDRSDASYQRLLEDEVPESWLPPLELPDQGLPRGVSRSAGHSPLQHKLGGAVGLRAVSQEGMRDGMHSVLSPPPTSAAPSVVNASRVASTTDMTGLSEILDGSGSAGASTTALSGDSRQVLGLKRTVSRARGIADSMEATPAFETPSRWPSIQGGLQAERQRLRLQIRATQCQAPPGRTYWSDPVELDALGGAAVVTVPSPLLPPTASIPAARAAYMMSVTASQVPGSCGALVLYLLPRYLLINTLDVPIQYKQQGTLHERELAAGASRSLRWSDVLLPLCMCVRVQEAGWLWSGGFELDSPGDMFVKIRHRDRGVTMLVRVDLATSAASGVLRVMLSHHPAGFAPYRIENCSLETLHARQHKVREQQDVLRPYCSLNYAWDEPSLPHRLVLELPGARVLGIFDLDKVGQDVVLLVPTKRGELQRRVRVLVRSEGPTRVLTVLDMQRHSLLEEIAVAPPAGRGGPAEGTTEGGGRRPGWPRRGPWDAWSLPTLGGAAQQQEKAKQSKASGLLWEVHTDMSSLGVSLVAPTREMAYLRVGGLHVQLVGTAAHLVLDLEMRRVQLDNPSPWVALPVTLQVPAPVSRLTSTVVAAVDVQRKPALVARLALWQRRPAGVLCIEQAHLQLAPVAVYVEQQHALQLAEFLAGMSAGLEVAAATAAAASAPAGSRGLPGSAGVGHGGATGGGSGGEGSVVGSEAPGFAMPASNSLGAVPSAAARLPGLSTDLEALLSGRGGALLAPAEQKVYIDVLNIATLELSITFLPAPFQPDPSHPRLLALQRMLSLADVEDARLKLAALELHNPLMGTSALAQLLQRHYMRALLPELYKVVGSASVFGDPVRLFHHLGLGVWSFLASPAAGLVESARQRGPRLFISGVASGMRDLFQNVVFALSNAAAKGSTAARKSITALGLDRLHPQDAWAATGGSSFRRRLRWSHEAGVGAGSNAAEGSPAMAVADGAATAVMFSPRDGTFDGPQAGGDGGVLGAVLLGVVGLAAEPIRGLDEDGLVGLLSGIKRGAIGVVVLPLASLLEMFASTAGSIRRAVAGSSNVGWLRPPRFVHAALPLEPYSWAEAMGRWLLTELERTSLACQVQRAAAAGARGLAAMLQLQQAQPPARHGAFVLCTPLAERSSFLVVTSKCVLCICAREPMWVPAVRWSSTIADLELVSIRGAHLSLVVQQPLRRHIVRSANVLPRVLADVLKAPRPPFSFLEIDCKTAAASLQLQTVLLQLEARSPPLASYIGHCQVLTAPVE